MATSRSIRRVDFRLAVAAALITALAAFATPALSAEVLDTRLGVHGDYTRIVFELDSPAGYQIQRQEGESGGAELLVSLDATASTQSLSAPKSDVIEGVDMEKTASGSTARIRLMTSKVRLKEMILANPARIVLDVMPTETASSAPVAAAPVEPAALAIPDLSTPEPVVAEVEKQAEESALEIAETVTADSDAIVEDKPVPSAMDDSAPAAPAPGPVASMPSASAPQQLAMASKPFPAARPSPAQNVPVPQMARPEPRPLPRAPRKLPPAPAAAPKPSSESDLFGIDLTTMGLAAVGLIGLVAAGGLMMRRRGRAEEAAEDTNAFDSEDPFANFNEPPEAPMAAAEAPTEMISVDDDDLPARLTDDAPVAKGMALPDANRLAPVAATGVESDSASSDDDIFGSADTAIGVPAAADAPESSADDAVAATVVMQVPEEVAPVEADDSSESNGDTFSNFDTVATLDPTPAVEASPEAFTVPSAPASSPGEVQELERRLVSAETRLDEALEAAERMERKIAAQTEELRVQRAAIARTQRAVRNLSRPDDEAGPTEPALRDPNQKSSLPD